MRNVMVVIAFVVAAVPVIGQSWTPPRTPWGDPDLQGFWPSSEMLGVPFERPANLGERATLTDEEFAQLPARRRATNANDAFFGESRDHWREYGKPQRQTSLIVDPPDGRLPPMTADGAKRAAALPNEARGTAQRPGEREHCGPVSLTRRARFDVADRQLQRQSDHPGPRAGRDPQRDDPGDAPRSRRRAPACWREGPQLSWATRAGGGKATRWSSTRPTSTKIADGEPAVYP